MFDHATKKAIVFVAAIILVATALWLGKEAKPAADIGHADVAAEKYQKIRLVMSTSGTTDGIDTRVAKRIAETVAQASNGAIIIEVYDSNRLAGGNTTQGVKMLADGSVDMAVFTSGTLSKIDRRMAIATLPWAFPDYQTARRVIDETGAAYYEKILSAQGLHFLGSTHNGMRLVSNNKRLVKTPDDMAGLKIRILGNNGTAQFFRLFHAVPMPMSRSEIPAALKQGIIDGHDISLVQLNSLDATDFYVKYISDLRYAYENHIFVANSKSYDRLDDKTRMLISVKTRAACDWGRNLLEENEADARKNLIADGVIINEPNDEELARFKDAAKPLIKKLKKEYGQEACAAFQIPYEE